MPPRIAVTSGEPAGIGPELCLRLAAYDGPAQPVILGDRGLLAERAKAIGLSVAFRDFRPENPVDRGKSRCFAYSTGDCLPAQVN